MILAKDFLSNLETLFQTENRIAEIVKKNGLRFSTNKMTADLGEFYVFTFFTQSINLVSSINQEQKSNADFDFLAKIKPDSILYKYFKKEEIKIEVKTRRNKEGLKYLSSLKPNKFDLLCVVDIAKDYTFKKIYLVTSETSNKYLDKKYQRLIFKDEMSFMIL